MIFNNNPRLFKQMHLLNGKLYFNLTNAAWNMSGSG